MSILAAPGPNWNKVKSLATTIWAYGVPLNPGVFFVQSAGNADGNDVGDGCASAYRPDITTNALPADGIMVVSASHHNGGAVTETRSFSRFSSPFGGETNMWPASPQNYPVYYAKSSPCTDIWAPGNLILSTWGIHLDQVSNNQTLASASYSGDVGQPVYGSYDAWGQRNPLNTTAGWVFLSGTSMAAPFVAAAAAWLADTYGYNTAGSLEEAVRSNYTLDTRPNVGESFPAVPVVRLP